MKVTSWLEDRLEEPWRTTGEHKLEFQVGIVWWGAGEPVSKSRHWEYSSRPFWLSFWDRLSFLHICTPTKVKTLGNFRIFTVKRSDGTSFSAIALACDGECPPNCPKVQAAAAWIWSSASFMRASLRGGMAFTEIIAVAFCSSKAAMYPRHMIPGSRAFPLESAIYSTKAVPPPALQINPAKSELCLATSLMHVAAFLRTIWSWSLSKVKILGKILWLTTSSASS